MKLSGTALTSICKSIFRQLSGESFPDSSGFVSRLQEHFGQDPSELPIIAERFRSYNLPNVHTAIQVYLSQPGKSTEVLGVVYGEHQTPALSELAVPPPHGSAGDNRAREGPIQYLNIDSVGNGQLTCIQRALYLVRETEQRLAIFFRAEDDILEDLHIEVMAHQRDIAERFLQDLRLNMHSHNIYRGKVLSISGGPWGNLSLKTHQLPQVEREDIILPGGLLEKIERQTIGFSRHADALRQSGHHLKRGILLHGRPGTGKTLTAMYLSGQMHGRTTLFLAGEGLNNIEKCCTIAKTLEPSIVILEDVDLVAEERTKRGVSTPLLFTLLNQMDGLASDSDVLFLLTTNRPEILEPALASRPGRIDQAFEIPMPDDDCRSRLLALYTQGSPIDTQSIDFVVKQTRGVSAAFIRELMRRAALLSLDDNEELSISKQHLELALSELLQGGSLTKRLLGFHAESGIQS